MSRIYPYVIALVLCVPVSTADVLMALSDRTHEYNLVSLSEYSLDDVNKSDDTISKQKLDVLQFHPMQRTKIDFGFHEEPIWIKTRIHNNSSRTSWILNLNTRFMNGLSVYVDRGGKFEKVLENGENSDFFARPIPEAKLALPLLVEQQETVTLYIRYWSRGTTALPLSLQTKERYAAALYVENLKYMGFYSVVGLLILFALFQFLFVNNRRQIIYIFYVGSVALYVLHMDGLSFKYLWPDYPEWNAFSSLPLGLLMTAIGTQFSRIFLDTRNNIPRFDIGLRIVFPIIVLILLYGILINSELSRKLAMLLNLYVVGVGLVSGVISWFMGMKSARFYVAGWMSLCLASLWTNIAHFLPFAVPVASSFDMIRIGIVIDALMFQLALADQANEIAKERDALVRREKSALKKQQLAERSMYKAEQELIEAMALAKQKTRALETTSHDLKQPLASMRLALEELKNKNEMDDKVVGRFEKSVDFLEFLADHSNDESLNIGTGISGTVRKDPIEFPVNRIITSIDAMFREEAEQKGLQLRCRSSSISICGMPNDILRIVSNFVSNSIRYTDSGKVLVGCRRRGHYLAIFVIDTGPGIRTSEQTSILEYGNRGEKHVEDGLGKGLGLSIAYQLAARHGYSIQLASSPGSGTQFVLEVPLATG